MLSLLISFVFSAEPIKVGVIDTGFNLRYIKNIPLCEPHSEKIHDANGHGTLVTGLIQKYAPKEGYCFYIAKGLPGDAKDVAKIIDYFRKKKVKVINYSGGSKEESSLEANAVSRFINSGGIFVAAAGNNGKYMTDLNCTFFPACGDRRIVVVANFNKNSNNGTHVDSIIDGNNKTAYGITKSGSSMSAAIQTGIIISDLIKVSKKHTDK